MNKKVSIKETSAIFLAIVLVLGTIAAITPSFIVGAQATSDREKNYDHDEDKKSYDKDDYESKYSSFGKYDRDHDKSKKDSNSVHIKKVKCNNINVNLNGIDVNIGIPNNGPVTNPVAVAQEVEDNDDEESNSIENDKDESYEGKEGQSDSNTNSFVCINNNNNIVVGEEEELLTCEECFTENLSEDQINRILDILDTIDWTLATVCESLANPESTNEGNLSLLDTLFDVTDIPFEDRQPVLECLESLGLITVGSGGDGPDH